MLVSFDLWGTLIKSSPSFKGARAKFVKDFFKKDFTDEFIDSAFESTKNTLNSVIEVTGWQPSNEIILRLLFSNLGVGYNSFSNFGAEAFQDAYQDLAIANPPLVYSDETIPALIALVHAGNTIKISSNTMFIKGVTLKKILFNMGMKYTTFHYFSDDLGYAKPNPRMYSISSIHIGDNILTDVHGPRKFGIKSFLINTNDKTIKDAVDFILATP
jgi:putative hydrolase of the HAD superfamily